MEKGTTVGKTRIAALFDAGTFAETGAYVKRPDGGEVGVVSGYGAIGGKLVYAFVQDSDKNKGAFDALQADKIAAVYAMALKNSAPVIGIFDSAGATVTDGSSAMAAYGKLLATVSAASGVIPQYALISGVCPGLSATVASMFDITVSIKEKSSWYVGAPFLTGKQVGSAEYTAVSGLSSIVCESEAEAYAALQNLVAVLPSNNEDGVLCEPTLDDANRLVNVTGLCGAALVSAIADNGSFTRLGNAYGKALVTGFASFGGVACGVIASDYQENKGIITADAAKKAARLISFCDSFSIPVITLIDSEGVEIAEQAESEALAAQLGKLAMAYAAADTAKITLITGKAYGAAFTLLGSKALGADLTYAVKGATVSVMAPESAVAFLWNDKITPDHTRAQVEAEWIETMASPEKAASDGSIDDVIDAAELRQRICSGAYMLLTKNSTAPRRKHCNLPL